MLWADASFPYEEYRGKINLFETYAIEEYEDEDDDYATITWHIDYSKELGMYRITRFKNNHWDGDLVFDEIKENFSS